MVLAPVAAETALQLYTRYVVKRVRLFKSDTQTGWSNKPDLLTTQTNAIGGQWTIRTDHNGQRIIAQNPSTGRRILILGDSLSFGEGIEVEDRFDVKMLPSLSGTRIINTGVMGYGTDQEYVAFRSWKHLLEAGDAVLIVLNQSDYFDVLRRRFFGQSKAVSGEGGRLLCSSAAKYYLLGTLERRLPLGRGRCKAARADRGA